MQLGHPHHGTGGGGGGRGGRRGGPGRRRSRYERSSFTFSVEAKRDTLPQASSLLGEILREPAFPVEEFETSQRRLASSMLSSGRTEPAALSRNKLTRTLSPYSKDDVLAMYRPRRKRSTGSSRSLLDQIKKLYETQIGGGHAELAIVGDFDPESTLRQLKEMLAGWESKVPFGAASTIRLPWTTAPA